MKRYKIIVLLVLMLILSACSQNAEAQESETELAADAVTEAATEIAPPPAVDIEKGEIDLDALRTEGRPILLQFSQDGCPPCEQMLPLIAQVQKDYADTVLVTYVDVHQNTALSQEYRIRMTPTQVFIDADGNFYEPENLPGIEYVDLEDGTRQVRHVGMIPEDLLRTHLDILAGE